MSGPVATHAYIGINAEGVVRAISFDDAGSEAENLKLIQGWLMMGRTVARLPAKEACQRLADDWDKP